MMRKIFNQLLNVFLAVSIVCACAFAYTSIKTGRPHVLGYRAMYVMSGSMEPTLKTGQFILTRVVSYDDIEVGDIVAYVRGNDTGKKMIVHRIIDTQIVDDEKYYLFKGDNNENPDEALVHQDQLMYKVILY